MKVPIILLAVGCAPATAPPPKARAPAAPSIVSSPVCPRFVDASDPYIAEVFPGCAPLPFGFRAAVCGGTCPQPCRRHEKMLDPSSNELALIDVTWSIVYDAGRFVAMTTTVNGVERALRCTADACRDERGIVFEFDRDAGHRIVAARARGQAPSTIRYDDQGVTSIDDGRMLTLHYGAGHRLVSERLVFRGATGFDNTITYQYDARGRVIASKATEGERESFTYDAGGHLSRYELRAFPDRQYQIDYEFDAKGRPTRAITGNRHGPISTTSWDYDCTAD